MYVIIWEKITFSEIKLQMKNLSTQMFGWMAIEHKGENWLFDMNPPNCFELKGINMFRPEEIFKKKWSIPTDDYSYLIFHMQFE